MGEIADLMLDGEICECCGCELGGASPGYPRRCGHCTRAHEAYKKLPEEKPNPAIKARPMPKVRCPDCAKAISARGIPDHLVAVHGYDK